MRRIAIVALARKLMIALWRYLEHGLVPKGAVLRPSLYRPTIYHYPITVTDLIQGLTPPSLSPVSFGPSFTRA